MARVIVYGFQRSTYVNIVRLVLTHKNVPFEFHDLESEMGSPSHLALHPFNRVPIFEHDGFRVYETSAIVAYIDDVFRESPLTPEDIRDRARMNQWISSVSSYYYYWFIFHLTHERLVFPELGIASDERVVARALPHIAEALDVLERELAHGRRFLILDTPTLADFFLLPSLARVGDTKEGKSLLEGKERIAGWLSRMAALPSVKRFRASQPPSQPIWHAREWAVSHRPVA
jgi:glutathione S-transferase